MEPVLQRFGDVTIQRVEKPKPPQPPPTPEAKIGDKSQESKEESSTSSQDEDSFDEQEPEVSPMPSVLHNLKRNLPETAISAKKFKFDQLGVGLDKKLGDDLLNFSDEEMSEFDSESEIDSEEEHVAKTVPKVSEDEGTNSSTSFLEKLVEDPFLDAAAGSSIKTENPSTDSEDYDYDIKEKLKEMGEISFETVKKGEKPLKKPEVSSENEVVVTPAKKPGVADEESVSIERKGNMRRNIREVMDETKLDEATLAAQRLEMERLQRVQEQQKLLRELQRQAAQERMQNKVISLLQGNNFSRPGPSSTRIGNTVLVKLPNGQTKPMTRLPKRPFDLLRVQKGAQSPPGPMPAPKNLQRSLLPPKKPGSHLTPSVSIAPVAKKPMMPIKKSPSDSESEGEELPAPKPKSKDAPVTTIDISSDDDCIVVSENEGDPGADDTEDDPSNSGMHTNDEFNQPDEQGRVVVNVGHPDSDPDIFLAPQIARIIKPHQIGGVRFLYDNVIESTSRFDTSCGFGCILAHSMGLGKTLQIVCFSDIFLRHTSAKTILCIMPINTLQNWMAEYNMWLPTEEAVPNSPLLTHGEIRPRNFNLHVLNDSHKTLVARAKVIHAWKSQGGVLLIGYEQFRLLSMKKHPKSRRKTPFPEPPDDDKNKKLFDDVHEALVKPGPDLVICDEGHRIKNSHASISQALKQMRTKRRIVLTGYPLQNNLMEYWCMVDFARPNYLGTKTEFCNMFERPIMNGQCIDSTEADIKLMRYRAHVLHSLLVGFVQRRSHTVLQSALPQKEEYVLLVRMTKFQRDLYETFMNEVVRSQAVPNPLKAFAVCCKIWNHPDVLFNFLKKRAGGEAVDIDLEEVANASTGTSSEASGPAGKPKRAPRAKKSTPRGKNGKPAASITPYTSTSEANQPQMQQPQAPAQPQLPTQPQAPTQPQTPTQPQALTQPQAAAQSQASSQSQMRDNTSFNIPQSEAKPPTAFNQNSENATPSEPSFNTTSYLENSTQYGQNFKDSHFPDAFLDSDNANTTFPTSLSSFNLSPSPMESNFEGAAPANQGADNTKSYLDISNPQNAPKTVEVVTNSPFSQSFDEPENASQPYSYSQTDFQNYWSQNDAFGPQPDFFSAHTAFNVAFGNNSNSNSSWMKKEEKASLTVKSECSNDSKPKINIISDIKLPSMFNSSNASTSDRKIKIISDIKLEPKKEEVDEKCDIKELGLVKDGGKKDEEPPPPPFKPTVPESPIDNTKLLSLKDGKEDSGIPYDWAIELLKDYVPGCIENSAKMEILFCIIRESISLGDRLLVFSQSLITLDLIEQFLQMNVVPGDSVLWQRNVSYYRLDGSTSALEREKLINEFNSNPKIHLFLVSTRAGSLGINLIGANRVVVLDASWNPCHDTQAVCRVYRYGQRKPCFVYRLVVDNCLEKKIYDRQINKQGMSDRVVDECNPDAHLTMKDVSTLCWDDKRDEGEEKDWSHVKDNYIDVVLQTVLERHGRLLNQEPFQHESLLVDRKEKQLSQQEKRLAKKSYEREKQAARQPAYNTSSFTRGHRPVASVRPMQQGNDKPSRWIPAEHWQRQGMTAQEMTLPLDVVIPTNQPEKGNIVLKAGQKVLVLKSPKGVYMQLESGKIVAIKTAIKVKGKAEDNHDPTKMPKPPILPPTVKVNPSLSVLPQKKVVKPFTPGLAKMNVRSVRQAVPNLVSQLQQQQNFPKKIQTAKTRPYHIGAELMKGADKKDGPLPGSSSDDEPNLESLSRKFDVKLPIGDGVTVKRRSVSLLKSQPGQRGPGRQSKKNLKEVSALEQLEQSTSLVLTENTPFQESLDSITNVYKDDGLEDEVGHMSSMDPKASDASDHSDEVTYVSEQPPQYMPQQNQPATNEQPKSEPGTDYPYNNYYNYQPYPPPPQNYGYPPAQPPPYDMMGGYPPQQPQPQYNYGYQGYPPPPQPHYPPPPPQPGYDYNAPPPQPMYPGYHNPYPQQYPPPPPPQNMYPPPPPPPAGAPPYQDYQYQQPPPMGAAPPPPTNNAPPMHSPAPNTQYYPTS